MDKFNEIKTRSELAEFLNIPISKLTYVLYVKKTENYYETFEIPKKNGGTRCINAPKGTLKEIQKKLADALWEYQKDYTKNSNIQRKVSHAFEKKKGIITNAIVHQNKRFVVNLDLKNFFDSFHYGRVRGYFAKNRNFQLPIEVATIIAQLSCYQGCLPQGAPSSPIITNLICDIFDMRLIQIARKYKLDYTRYADDLTFSTNDRKFLDRYTRFLKDINAEITKAGFLVNNDKTRIVYRDSRQEVTGLVVNKKISICREYYKDTRAMADSLYKNGEFKINDVEGTINQLEGRFAFINQIDWYNNQKTGKKKPFVFTLNAREKQYQLFLFFKYFFTSSKPLIVTEGKTDIDYLKAALKKHYKQYPSLITQNDGKFEFHISFLVKSRRLEYFFNLQQDGADAMKNIYNLYTGKSGYPNLYQYIENRNHSKPNNPVILIFDNEQNTDRPLKEFKRYIKVKDVIASPRYINIVNNLYLLTCPLVKGKDECEIEDLFDDTVLNLEMDGKTFSKDEKTFDKAKNYGKAIFSQYIAKNYETIDFDEFKPMFDDLENIISEYRNLVRSKSNVE